MDVGSSRWMSARCRCAPADMPRARGRDKARAAVGCSRSCRCSRAMGLPSEALAFVATTCAVYGTRVGQSTAPPHAHMQERTHGCDSAYHSRTCQGCRTGSYGYMALQSTPEVRNRCGGPAHLPSSVMPAPLIQVGWSGIAQMTGSEDCWLGVCGAKARRRGTVQQTSALKGVKASQLQGVRGTAQGFAPSCPLNLPCTDRVVPNGSPSGPPPPSPHLRRAQRVVAQQLIGVGVGLRAQVGGAGLGVGEPGGGRGDGAQARQGCTSRTAVLLHASCTLPCGYIRASKASPDASNYPNIKATTPASYRCCVARQFGAHLHGLMTHLL